ncbi:MAG: hypothetical protein A3E85_04850 [Gammaproteobacteria bacterium RIFCSPHIGHO2_12_FULL_45_12]|nr:MAG: hypothetical protein A3E85_04850 [Gammaproteobacteria bacterium RIFCSPHIGHO2_12_FULL_45_12]
MKMPNTTSQGQINLISVNGLQFWTEAFGSLNDPAIFLNMGGDSLVARKSAGRTSLNGSSSFD